MVHTKPDFEKVPYFAKAEYDYMSGRFFTQNSCVNYIYCLFCLGFHLILLAKSNKGENLL